MNAKRSTAKARTGVRKRRAQKSPRSTVVVTAEERQHLIEDVAYFRAERYRCCEPGQYREQDRREAEAEINAVLKRCRKR